MNKNEIIKNVTASTNVLSQYNITSYLMKVNADWIKEEFSESFIKAAIKELNKQHKEFDAMLPPPLKSLPSAGGVISSPVLRSFFSSLPDEMSEKAWLAAFSEIEPIENVFASIADGERFLNWIAEYANDETTETTFFHKLVDTNENIIVNDETMKKAEIVLNKWGKNNIIFVGNSGVGKTSMVVALSRVLAKEGYQVNQLDVSALVAGSKYRGEMEEKLLSAMKSIEDKPNMVVFIDEMHTIFGAGASSESPLDVSNILKPYLANKKMRFIGTTTNEEYHKYFENDNALCRRMQKIVISEPSRDEAVKILQGVKPSLENHYSYKIKDDAVESAVDLSIKYIRDRYLPDKAIDLLDEAVSIVSVSKKKKSITKADVVEAVSKICRIPSENINSSGKEKLIKLKPNLCANVFGQDEAINAVVQSIYKSQAGLSEANKPIASILAVGPTGTGKTELARTVANTMDIPFIKFDMSEYADQTAVNKFVGASAGYVGYEDGSILVKTIKDNPHCVLLLDEIEKAHPSIFNVLLQVMDDATLTDAKGNKADFRNVIIMMTSNAGAATVKSSVGFGAKSGANVNTSGIDDAVKHTFSPEFRNRLSAIIKFNPMSKEMASKIAEKQLNKLSTMLLAKGVVLSWENNVIDTIVNKVSDFTNGGREIIRICDNEIKDMFVTEILFGSLSKGGSASISVKDNAFVINALNKKSRALTK